MDGGDFLHRVALDRTRESIATWREMERLGYDAVAMGEMELRQWELTDSLLQAGSTLPLVTTNVERNVDGHWRPVGERYLLLDIKGVRIGVISALPLGRTSSRALEQTRDELRLLPAMETTREMARLLKRRIAPRQAETQQITSREEVERLARDQADLIVLLGYLDQQGMQSFADSIPEIDVILGGYRQPRDEGPQRLGHAIVNRSGNQGQIVCVTGVTLSPSNELLAFGGENVLLTKDYPEDPAVAAIAQAAKDASDAARKARLERLRAQNEERLSRQRERREARLAEKGTPAPSADDAGLAERERPPVGADSLRDRPVVRGRRR